MTDNTPKDTPFPHVSTALLKTLERIFDRRYPAQLLDPQEYAMRTGHAQVLHKLRVEHDRQEGNDNLHVTKV